MTSNAAPTPPTGLVAVVGLGCVLPDANNPAEFWENMRSGRSSIREVPHERWDPALYWSPDRAATDKTYAKIGAFVTGFKFNPVKFRIPPSVIKSLDDSQLWALEAAQQCLADAGYDKKEFNRARCAVILGNAMGGETQRLNNFRFAWPVAQKALRETAGFSRLPQEQQDRILADAHAKFVERLPEITEDTMPGELSNVIAGRIANVLNLGGKNFTTDAACASSLAAIDAATKALLYGEADLVITGGVDRSMDVGTYVKFSKIGALSAAGSFPYDARADGFVMGEGAAMVLLKRYEDAVRDGDRVYAVLRGVGSSSDGKGKGITAPNPDGQLKCVQRAFEDAGIAPSEVDLMEGHGTSTKVGDVVEVQVLQQIFEGHVAQPASIPLGSVKSNIGHLKGAAGAAGLLKVVLGLHHRELPPSINFQQPNPNVDWAKSPFFVLSQATPWPDPPAGRPRRAAISSFGFGGTNFHLIVEEYAPGKNTPKAKAGAAPVAQGTPAPPTRAGGGVASVLLKPSAPQAAEPLHAQARMDVLLVGAATVTDLQAELMRLQDRVRRETRDSFARFLHGQNTTALGRHLRVALVVESPTDAVDNLQKAIEGVVDARKRPILASAGIHYGEGKPTGKIAFLFPGQGSQYADMTRDLATRFQSVRRTLQDADRVMVPLVGKPLTEFLFTAQDAGRTREAVEESLKRTEITQPAVLTADTAIYRLLSDYGVKPDLVAGHSLGEYGALIAAGVLTFEDALLAVSARGREMANVHVPDLGKMASISSDPGTVEAKLKHVQGYVIPANKNCKVQTVIAGSSAAVDAAVKMFQQQGIAAQLIPVSAAFHSSIVAPATEPLRRVLAGLDLREPKVPILSNVHADYYPKGANARDAILDLLSRQVAAPVEWQKQIARMHKDGARVFIEVGPKSVLTTFVKNILEGQPHAAIATNHPKKGGFFHAFDAIALLAAAGYPVRFPASDDRSVHTAAYRGEAPTAVAVPPAPAIPALVPAQAHAAASPGVTGVAFPNLRDAADRFIREKQEELRRVLTQQLQDASPPVVGGDGELAALRRSLDALGINLEPVLISGVSVGTPGSRKQLFDDENFERIWRGENSIDNLAPHELQRQVDKNIKRLVKSPTGDHRFEAIQDVADVIKLAGKRGAFDLEDYGVNQDFADALDITSKMALAAGVEALRDARIPLVRGYVKTTTGKFLPGEWALPEPLQHETGVIFASVWPGVPKIIDHVSRSLANEYARRSAEERRALYRELAGQVRDPVQRRELESWCDRHEAEIAQGTQLHEFNRRFLFHVLGMGHSQLAQFIRARGPNTAVQAACSTTTQAVGIAEDWIRLGRCKRVLIVGADDVTGPEMLEYWASGFLAAGAATTEGDVTKAALPFDRRRHGMIIGMGAVGIVVEAESVVKDRGMEGIAEILASSFLNSAYHGSRLDTEHVAKVMDDLLATVEKRTGTPRGKIAEGLLFMSHETYTPARGGSAAAEIEALTKTFGADVSKVVVANTKGFTGHPMAVGIEDAIAIRSLQMGRVPPIANLKEPDPSLGNIQLSRGGAYHNLEYALRLGAGFGSQIAMYVVKLRAKGLDRVVDGARYQSWLQRVSGAKTPELEVVHRTLRVKASLPALVEADAPRPKAAPVPPAEPAAPVPVPAMAVAAAKGPPSEAVALGRIVDLVAEKTGYPRELLEPDLDLEADLGIDTVKQAELFGILREEYGVERDDTVPLKDYNTLRKIAAFMVARASGAAPKAAQVVVPKLEPAAAAPVVPAESVGPSPDRAAMLQRLVAVVAQKTGYPTDLLEPDLDLEADLGIDTVKQAEIFGLLREEFRIARDDTVQIKDYNTLHKIVDYFSGRPGTTAVEAPKQDVAAPAPATRASTPTTAPTNLGTTKREAADAASALSRIRSVVAEKTGYPLEMLEPDLDLEADLGIDTVKQAELFGLVREEYGIPRRDDVQLKDYNTLRKLADFIVAGSAAAPARATSANLGTTAAEPGTIPVKPVVPKLEQPAPGPANLGTTADAQAMLQRVRAVVAEKTGYPLDMLDADLDLEADLGIDTVKQAELFGLIRDEYGIPRRDDIQLKDYNTLRKLADFMGQSLTAQEAAPTPAPTSQPDAKEPVPAAPSAPAQPRTTHRYVVRYAAVEEGPPRPKALQGKTLLVWAPPHHRADLLHVLKQAGATGIPLEALPTRFEEALAFVAEQRTRTPRLNGVLFVPTPNPTGSGFGADDAHVVKALFHLVKALLVGAKSGELDLVGVVTFLGGDFGLHGGQPINPLEGGLVGLAKAVARELPAATVKCVDVAPRTEPPALAQALVEELERNDGPVEVGTYGGGRGTLRLLEQETVEEEPGIELRRQDVLVVSGGGSGITSDIVQRLALQAPASFVLLGRTPLHADAASFARFSDRDWNAKRVDVQTELKARGERVTPVAVDRALNALKKSAEIHSTLEALRAAGGRAEYHAVDVTDAQSVERAMDQARRNLGPITGLLHAAGLEESKLIVDKTTASFDRVFDAKVLGARNLLAATERDPVRFFIAFTSIAGRLGNAGQADYSAANDALAKLCSALRTERGHAWPATAIDWSAWADKGMATRGSVLGVLREAGVTPIPLEEGVQRFLDEVAHGCQDAEVLVAGQLGRLAPPDAFTTKDAVLVVPARAQAAPPRDRETRDGGQQLLVVEDAETPHGNLLGAHVTSDGRTATATLLLDPAKDPYLRDHRVDGVPYLPGVMGQEAMAEVASRLATGKRYVGARDLEFRLPVKCLRDQPLEVTIIASLAHDAEDRVEVGCRLQSVFTNAKGERIGAPRIHFTGTLLFASNAPAAPKAPEPDADLERVLDKRAIYEQFFHGPSFRVLNTVGLEANGRVAIGVWADPQAPLFSDRAPRFLTSPMLRELAYQTAGSLELFHHHYLSLPKADGRLSYVRDAPVGAAVRAVATFKELRDNVAHFDVVCATTEGDVLFRLEDFQLIRLRPSPGGNGGSTPAPAAATEVASTAPAPTANGPPTVYKARWGHDLPLPLSGVTGVLVQQDELESMGVTAEETLTSGERTDQARYRNDRRAREFFAGRLAAKEAIAQLKGRPVREARGVEVRRLETGEPQPRGSGLENVLVSITHWGDAALAVAAERGPQHHTIGVDVEKIEEKPKSFEAENFTDAERRLLERLVAQGAPRAAVQVRFWAVKEAVLKALGKGFALDVRHVEVRNLDGAERVTVALAEPARSVLSQLGAQHVRVQTWLRDGLACALAWTLP